jgi:hypothetical protein
MAGTVSGTALCTSVKQRRESRDIVAHRRDGNPMRVDRRFLYAGLFLVAVGVVLVAADLGVVDTPLLADTLRLWPLALLAIGAALVLRRTEVSLPTGLLGAALPGLLLGGALAVAPRYADDCGERGEATSVASEEGVFSEAATVSLTTACGTLSVRTAPGDRWQLNAANTGGPAPRIERSAASLSVTGANHDEGVFLDPGRDAWEVTLPTSEIDELGLEVNAGSGDIALAGAQIRRLEVTAHMGEMVVDASGASIAELNGDVNFGSFSIVLPASDLTGSVSAGAADLRICRPPGVGLRLSMEGDPLRVTVAGERHRGSEWQSDDYATATHHADLDIEAHFTGVEIDPIGGCK